MYQFQSTLPRGERRWLRLHSVLSARFNPRSHEESDFCNRVIHILFLVSIHAPTRGATYERVSDERFDAVSIHAPTRGATWYTVYWQSHHDVSIHAPTRGATRSTHPNLRCHHSFNPRSHEGSDGKRRAADTHLYDVSIHAPTRGATVWCIYCWYYYRYIIFFANVTITTYVQLIFWCWYCVTHYKLVTANSLENMLHYTFAPYHITIASFTL